MSLFDNNIMTNCLHLEIELRLTLESLNAVAYKYQRKIKALMQDCSKALVCIEINTRVLQILVKPFLKRRPIQHRIVY